MEYIYFLEWICEKCNLSPDIILKECDPENCGWRYPEKDKNLKIIQKINDGEYNNVFGICDALFDWGRWKDKYKDTEFEKFKLIDTMWKNELKSTKKNVKFSRYNIKTFNQFDLHFDLKFE